MKRGIAIPGAQREGALPGAEMPWREWLVQYFPSATAAAMSPRHELLWEWFDSLTPGQTPRSLVAPWPRGGGKSTTGELGVVRLGVKLTRRFALWVNETQDQADAHVQAIAGRFESLRVNRAVGRYGSSKGWRRDQLRTENGFNVAAFGLDTAARGVKLDEYRPDIILFDDIDGRHDKKEATAKKIARLTQSLLPAGSSDCAVLFLQNLIHKDSIVSMLCDGRADFLYDREVAEIEPAVRGLEFEMRSRDDGTTYYSITGGEATWDGQNLATCEEQLNKWGRCAFLREAQHRIDDEEDGLWSMSRDIEPNRRAVYPPLIRVVVGLDPTASKTGDEAGIILAGIALEKGVLHAYVLDDKTDHYTPSGWANATVNLAKPYPGALIVAESNQGGEMVENAIKTVLGAAPVKLVHVHDGKLVRAEPIQKLYEDGRVHHVGRLSALETEMCSYQKGDPSPNRMDALVGALTELMIGGAPNSITRSVLPMVRRRRGFV